LGLTFAQAARRIASGPPNDSPTST
jgi:hypothetical protein